MRRLRARVLIAFLGLILLIGLLGPAALGAGSGARAAEFGPWSVDPRHPAFGPAPPPARLAVRPGATSSPFELAHRLWSEALSRIDGPRCAHRPSCSAFAQQALARHRLPLGFWMALDRLMRGAHSSALRTLPVVATPAGVLFVDELSDHAFWRPGYSPWSGWKK